MTSTPAKSVSTPNISCGAALELIAAARAAAKRLGVNMAVAVTDTGGHLRAFERADHAPFLVAEVAINKAWTAASFGRPTHVWNEIVQSPEVSPLNHHPRMTALGGGYPVVENGQVIGGLGLSGGSSAQDQQAAEEALREMGFEVK
ncbi:heme-binding protein [Deinococcus detaillensis]|uniref:Heme-binding protein n=1 Tax=Deinococcus detaillensis TaxID=2592048 RepID=A0A553V685_9DEIO|nr:heme-binding protein [Deinococcus detaillensis]TSA87944.1 heme-binding protein [Deinococcus detaillensis]